MTWQRDDSHAIRRPRAAVKPNGKSSPVSRPVSNVTSSVTRGVAAPVRAAAASTESAHNREHVGYLIKELQHLLRTQIESRIRSKGLLLSFPHSTVLMTLSQEPGLSGAQLARRNSVTAQTMNGLLMPLEAKGLIERRPDPENARILRCYLLPKGSEVLIQGMHEAGAVFDLMLAGLTEREHEAFRGILHRCIAALSRCSTGDAGAAACPAADRKVETRRRTRAHAS